MTVLPAPKVEQERAQDDPISEMIYLMGHDLRASIRAVTELPNWLQEELEESDIVLSDTVRDFLRLLKLHGRRLDLMVQAFTKYAAVGKPSENDTHCPAEVVADRISEVGFPPHWTITQRIGVSSFPLARYDAVMLMTELLENAKRHADHGAATLDIDVGLDAGTLRIAISDSGPGIPEADLEKALRPLSKLTGHGEEEGVGMGLAIVRRIVEKYNGTLSLGPAGAGEGLRIDLALPT